SVGKAPTCSLVQAGYAVVQGTVSSFVFAEGVPSSCATTLDAVSIGIGQPGSTYSNCQHGGHDQDGVCGNHERGYRFHGHFGGRHWVGRRSVSRVRWVEPYPPDPGIHSIEGFRQ
ncbi:MAG: hypothetical protein ABI298_01945, partial [Acidimicrobiales bacterium]